MNSKIQIFNGADGIKKAYLLCLKEKQLNIICFANNYEKILGNWFDGEFSPKLYALPTREILPDTAENRAFAKGKNPAKNAVKFFSGTLSQSDVVTSDSMAVLISYDETEPLAVVISDLELAKGLKSQFEVMWGSL